MERNSSKSSGAKLELSDIVDTSYLQAMHETFSDDMQSNNGIQVASAILDEEASPITFELNHCSFCKEVRKTKAGVQQCRLSDRKGIELARKKFEETKKPKPVFYICRQGLVDFCAPVTIGEKIVAYFFGGQFRCSCKYEYRDIKTPDQPTLNGLLDVAKKNKEEPDVTELNAKFKNTQELNQGDFDKLKDAARALTHQLNSVVKKLDEWKGVKMVDDFMKKAVKVHTIEGLFKLTVDSLPGMMEARYCSIFTVQQNNNEEERLVLQKTSYPGLQSNEKSAYYDKGEGLTGWVWKNARSLRLKDVKNRAELSQYLGLEWKGKHNDSDEHKGFLCVPMIGRRGEVIGVIRMPHKIRKPDETEEERGFTRHNEVFLNFLARHLSWVMEYQAVEDKFEHAVGPVGVEDKFEYIAKPASISLLDAATKLARAFSHDEIFETTLRNSLALFGGEGKEHFVCSHKPGSEKWKIECAGGGLDLDVKWIGKDFHTSQGITGRAIRENRVLFSSNLQQSENNGEYLRPVEDGESIVSVPLYWGNEVYGAISIISNKKFEFSVEKQQVLVKLGELAGAAIRNAKFRRNVLRLLWKIIRKLYNALTS